MSTNRDDTMRYRRFRAELGVTTEELQELFAQEVLDLTRDEQVIVRDNDFTQPEAWSEDARAIYTKDAGAGCRESEEDGEGALAVHWYRRRDHMGMYIEIEGDYPCAKCGKPLTGWQSKELRRDRVLIDPAAQIGEPVALAPGMDGEIHNGHDDARCDYYTEYAVTDGTIGDAKNRRMGWSTPVPGSHTIPTDTPLAHTLAEARGKPVIAVANGVRYTLAPEDPFAFYDPERVRAAVERSAGAFTRAGVDGEQLLREIDRDRGLRYRDVREMIREAKPTPLPTEYGEETRYGRESHSNSRYNDALDDYERALLERLDRHEAGE